MLYLKGKSTYQCKYSKSSKQLQKKTFHKMSKQIVFDSVEPSERSLQILNQVLSDKSTEPFYRNDFKKIHLILK